MAAMESSFWYRATGDASTDRKVVRAVAVVLISVLSLWLIYRLRTPILWLILAAFLAIAAAGPVNLLERRIKRGFAIALVYLGILLIPALIGAVLVPPLVNSTVDLVKALPGYVHDFQQQLQHNNLFNKLDQNFDINQQLTDGANKLAGNLGSAAGTLGSIGAGVLNSIFAGITILILSMFMVARGQSWIEARISRRPPHEAQALDRTVKRVAAAVSGYIGGAIAQAFAAFLAALIVLSLIGAPSPLVLAAIVGAFDIIPMIGSALAGVIVGVVTLFGDFPLDPVIWIVFVIAYQQFENYVVQPQIQRRAVALEPFVVLVAVLFGGTLMGVVGAILAIPVAAAIQIVFQEFRTFKRELSGASEPAESATPL